MAKDINRYEVNRQKKREERSRKKERSESRIMPHGNQYRRQRQKDREESYNDYSDYL